MPYFPCPYSVPLVDVYKKAEINRLWTVKDLKLQHVFHTHLFTTGMSCKFLFYDRNRKSVSVHALLLLIYF